MLSELRIKQLGVIEQASLTPGPGLTVVTGETGAGKTMVVTGLGLVAGARADASVVRNRAGLTQVEASFTQVAPACAEAVEAAGGLIEDDELLVVRQVSAAGRSRSWVGGTGVTQAVAQQIGAELVTVHGQSEQVRLSSPERQRQVLDRWAGEDMAAALARYRTLYDERKWLTQAVDELVASARERTRESDMLKFGLSEIDQVAPEEGEDAALLEEAKRLVDVDDLRRDAYIALAGLAGDDDDPQGTPALVLLASVRTALAQAARRDPAAAPLSAQAEELAALASDLAGQTSTYLADLSADPLRLEWIETRLAAIKTLTRKYGQDATAVRVWADHARERLAALEGSDERIASMTARLEVINSELVQLASEMTGLRTAAAGEFATQVAGELAALAMPHARVEFLVTPLPELGPWGADAVAMLFTANPGSEPAPLGKVASGGELSRVRLAIEVVLADSLEGQTMVFDEVDAGIGGSVGLQVGLRLARLAGRTQVIVVTHLAQVAAFATTHYVVTKSHSGGVTAADLVELTGKARLAELARMMGGLDRSASSLAHAQELVDRAAAMLG